jgi:hypothetical protein
VAGLEDTPGRRLDAASVAREIGRGHEPAGPLDREGDPPADVTAIEAVARGIDRGLPALRGILPLGRDEGAQGVGQFRLAEDAAHRRDGAPGTLQVHAGAARKGRHPLELRAKVDGEELVPREAVCKVDGGSQRLGERHRAELGERDAERIHHRRKRACGRAAGGNPTPAEDIDRSAGGGRPLAIDDEDLSPIGEIHDDRDLATQAEVGDLGDAGRERRRHPRIDRIAPTREHAEPRLGREVSPGSDDTDVTEDLGPIRRGADNSIDRKGLATPQRRGENAEREPEPAKTRGPGRAESLM